VNFETSDQLVSQKRPQHSISGVMLRTDAGGREGRPPPQENEFHNLLGHVLYFT